MLLLTTVNQTNADLSIRQTPIETKNLYGAKNLYGQKIYTRSKLKPIMQLFTMSIVHGVNR